MAAELPDLASVVRTCVAASTAAPRDEAATYYAASARVALDRLREEVRALELLVMAREAELVRRAGGQA